jgi:hypothetical protein
VVLQIKAQELGMNISRSECEVLLPRILSGLKARRGAISDEELRRLIEER